MKNKNENENNEEKYKIIIESESYCVVSFVTLLYTICDKTGHLYEDDKANPQFFLTFNLALEYLNKLEDSDE